MALLKDTKPELFTPESIQRKKEIVYELFHSCQKLRIHLIACKIEEECEICNTILPYFVNYMLYNELKYKGKLNYSKMEKDGIIDQMIFSKGINFNK